IYHSFEMPEGATRLTVEFSYSPKRFEGVAGDNNIGLGLFDPQGARGAAHARPNNDFTVSAIDATPGFVSGALQSGTWSVVMDTHMIMPNAPVQIELDIQVTFDPITGSAPVYEKGVTAPRGTGWYRGDLHGHTIHSDGHWDVSDFVQYARDYKLDFVTLTDHNTISGLAQHDSYSSDDLLTMGGVELTTYNGHCLALGTREWLEWRVRDGLSMPDIAQAVMDAGAYYIIAHPMSEGDPTCTGCDWQYVDMMPGNAPAVEIWNSPWDSISNNNDAVLLWYSWLNQGYRLVATAGTDIHGPAQPDEKLGFDVVYAEGLSEAAILNAIRQGHLYVSGGPTLELTGNSASGKRAMMGDSLPQEDTDIHIQWSGCADGEHLRLVTDGKVIEEKLVEAHGEAHWNIAAAKYSWCVVEIRDAVSNLRALTNPIYWRTA
ncbi:MAG: CehA/McbA family metallohydrolase, partial [Anaerolineae bacterium]|nr:CehA/McbA family metallohydrolase [Anaerolineae bacterium]